MKITINQKYMITQGLFWMLYCVAMGFVSLYLLAEGVSNSVIGITSASFGVISAVSQTVFGRLCDTKDNVSWKKMIISCLILFSSVCIIMTFISGKLFSILAIGSLTTLANLIMPFVNSALFYYEGAGEKINFGVARGIGSGMYAVVAVIIGNVCAATSPKAVPVAGIIVCILFIITVATMPYDRKLDTAKNTESKGDSNKGYGDFIKRNKAFIIMTAGFVLLSSTHNITCNFMLQIIQNLGGDSTHLGTCMAIQAVVEVPVLFCFAYLIKRFSSTKLMVIAAFGYLVKATCFYVAGTIPVLYTIQLAQMISFAVFASASVYYTEDMVDKSDRTTGQSLMAGAIVAGNIVGSSVGGLVLDKAGVKSMLLVNICLAVVGALVAVYAAKKGKETE